MKTALLAALAALLLTPMLSTRAALADTDPIERALAFILTTQQDDGGFQADLAFGPGQTFDAIYAIRAAGLDPATLASTTGATPADFLAAHAPSLAAPLAAKGILAAVAMGLDPRAVGDTDLVAVVEAAFDPESGRHHGSDFIQALIVIALVTAGAETPAETLDALRAGQAGGRRLGLRRHQHPRRHGDRPAGAPRGRRGWRSRRRGRPRLPQREPARGRRLGLRRRLQRELDRLRRCRR